MVRIGIIGVGVVGNAVYKSFNIKGIDTIAYDKYKNIGNIDDIFTTNMVFLCLPTLYNEKIESYDKSSIHEICSLLRQNNYKGLVIIKSTVEPQTSQNIAEEYGLFVVHNPEFLTAKTAFEDFHDQQHIVLGKTSNILQENIDDLEKFYRKYYPNAEITICSSTESECIKIFCNCFYAVKIQYFNEIYALCQKLGADYDMIKNIMLKNNWINPMHTQVPGTDGKMSYGGMCFPKDTNALLSFMKSKNSPHNVLEAVIKERNSMRDD